MYQLCINSNRNTTALILRLGYAVYMLRDLVERKADDVDVYFMYDICCLFQEHLKVIIRIYLLLIIIILTYTKLYIRKNCSCKLLWYIEQLKCMLDEGHLVPFLQAAILLFLM